MENIPRRSFGAMRDATNYKKIKVLHEKHFNKSAAKPAVKNYQRG